MIYEGGTKIEGIVCGDVDGDGEIEVLSLDQTEGIIRLHKHPAANPTGTWTTISLQTSRLNLQDAQAIDIDGDGRPEIVYTWEGNGTGSGGVNWLDYDGDGDVMDTDNWNDYVMVQHEGSWWLASSQVDTSGSDNRVDLSGDTNDTDIVFSSRDNANPNAVPGIYWIEEPGTVTDPWTLHTIIATEVDWLQCDIGDFSGNGPGKDVLSIDHTAELCWFDFSDSWAKHTLALPAGTADCWNCRTMTVQSNGRDDIMLITEDGIYRYEWSGSAYVSTQICPLGYSHPMEDRIIWHDLDGDSVDEGIIPDSGSNYIGWLDL